MTDIKGLRRLRLVVALIGGIFFGLVATVMLILGFIVGGLNFLSAAVTMLLYLKAVLMFLIFFRTRPPIRCATVLLPMEWKILGVGWVITALLFLVSGLIGEGVIGFFGVPVYFVLALIFWKLSVGTLMKG